MLILFRYALHFVSQLSDIREVHAYMSESLIAFRRQVVAGKLAPRDSQLLSTLFVVSSTLTLPWLKQRASAIPFGARRGSMLADQ